MTLEDQIKELSGHIDILIASMLAADTPEFEINFADKVLRPALIGITVGHAAGTPFQQVENAIVDTFGSIIMELMKRAHRNTRSRERADEVAIHVERILRELAHQCTEMVEDNFGPRIKLVSN